VDAPTAKNALMLEGVWLILTGSAQKAPVSKEPADPTTFAAQHATPAKCAQAGHARQTPMHLHPHAQNAVSANLLPEQCPDVGSMPTKMVNLVQLEFAERANA